MVKLFTIFYCLNVEYIIPVVIVEPHKTHIHPYHFLKGTVMASKKSLIPIMVCIGLILLIISFTDTSRAQRGRMSIDERVKSLTAGLSLTQAQADGVRKIYSGEEQERNKLFEVNQTDRNPVRAAMSKITKGVDEKIKALLTDEQKVKYDKIKHSKPRRMSSDRRKQGN